MLDQPLTADGDAADVGAALQAHGGATKNEDGECGNGTGRKRDESESCHNKLSSVKSGLEEVTVDGKPSACKHDRTGKCARCRPLRRGSLT
jgi:uncharacterized Zn-binding protein involved in type VI secretion